MEIRKSADYSGMLETQGFGCNKEAVKNLSVVMGMYVVIGVKTIKDG